jgi:hypothetical protein
MPTQVWLENMKGGDQLRTCVYIGDNIKMYLKETGWEGEDWIHLVALGRNQWQTDVHVMIVVVV